MTVTQTGMDVFINVEQSGRQAGTDLSLDKCRPENSKTNVRRDSTPLWHAWVRSGCMAHRLRGLEDKCGDCEFEAVLRPFSLAR